MPVHRFMCCVGFGVPDRGQCIADVLLVDVRNWHFAELGKNLKAQRREPPSSFAIIFKLGFARFECVPSNNAK